ncbi:hypothetical protein L198_03819 [Cryptococcus wingfieldii CBS 7118]|uniref:Uncharacterized protein n=1 Tax=Cryptococcus wingfieldii CBS 7118 TaxID=1295528 RepID=A0A1E3JAW4_9TREE|nr:hypothetical protein L198_03819 [Cryptococcus wingfieldii CBS 7118]ODN97256.1 hypothetical protein L198_03819 [Cryptococcus wingfieldii CBS 7118]
MASTTYNGPFLPPIHTSFTPLLSSPTDLITSQELHSALDRNLSDSFESLHDLYQVNEEEAEEDWTEESDQIQVYRDTKPLRVRKKKGRSTKVIYVANRRRSTIVSVPRSPLSPKSPVSPRSPTSFDSDSAHAHISKIFPSLPEPSPTMAVPLVYQPNRLAPVTSTDRQGNRSSGSSLHLGLGGSSSYDPICPGPSPPSSPIPSPNKRHFTSPTMYESSERPRKPLPAVPSSPITPSRAPRKAAKLLGVDLPPVMEQEKKKNYAASALKAGRHFRPLPNVALAEIEKFFGEVPKKASKSHPGLKTGKKASNSFYKGNSAHGVPEACDRNIGEGQTVDHRGEDGSMWLDVEEEQEFAWLMSEAIAAVPAPLPSVDDLSESIGGTFPVKRRDRCIDDMSTLCGSDEEEDSGKWGMEAFTSILSVPKPKASRASPSSSPSPSKSRPKPLPLVRRANKSNPDSSFMEIETPKRLDFSFDISPARDLISFFEPVTPVERMGPMYGGGAGPGAAAGTKGKGWLKRAMKPLRSQSREAGPRVYV